MLSLFFALFGVASAGCGLSTTIDPNGVCVTDANGYSTLDADTEGANIPISLTIEKKDQTTDPVIKIIDFGDALDQEVVGGRLVGVAPLSGECSLRSKSTNDAGTKGNLKQVQRIARPG